MLDTIWLQIRSGSIPAPLPSSLKMCARWKDPKRSPAACQKILDQYRKADGSALFLVNEFLVGPLVQLVDLHDEIPDAERVAIVRQALNAPSTENLLRQVTAGESAFLRKPKHPFTLVSQISTRYFSEMRHVAAKGVRHTFSRHLPPKFEQDEMIRQYSSYIHPGVKMPTDYSFVRTRVTERTAHSAANAAQHHLHLLLGLWNFHLFRPTATRWSSGLGPTPFAELRLGPIHTIHNATTGKPASSSFWFEDTYRRPFLSTRFQGKWQEVRDFERVARRRLGRLPFRRDVEESFIRYGRALEEVTSYETTLVRLWGILEQLTHTDRYATLRRRVLFLFEDGTGIDGLILDDLRERRNVEVHREAMSRKGGSARSQASVMAMKRYVEELLLFVLKAGHLFKSLSEVGEFLDSPTNESEIGRRRRLTQFAEHFLAGRPFPGRLKR